VSVTGQTARESSPLSKALGVVILAERSALGLSREQVEAASGVSYSTIRRIEAGERVPTVSQIDAIAKCLDMRGSELTRLAEDRIERDERRRQAKQEPHPSIPLAAEVADIELQLRLEREVAGERHAEVNGE
jgi:transcriptional regulator with XRE-family HTH domain